MKRAIILTVLAFALPLFASAQSKTNETMSEQIRRLKIEKSFTLSFDAGSNTSKLMVVSENFSEGEANKSGILAMNFATGFFYPGRVLANAPDPILLTFWVLSKKPRFGESQKMIVTAGVETIDMGDARYVFRARDNMEYLNFILTREQIGKIAKNSNVSIKLGNHDFTFTREHLKIFADLLLVSDPSI